MDGFGSHTFRWENAEGEGYWVKFHFKTDQGIETLTSEQGASLAGADQQALQKDLYEAIERGEAPSWTLKVQIMPEADAANYRFNPFDLTKVWPHSDYPLIVIGRMTLDRNPDNYFASVEQAAFDPGHFVPGIGPSPDRMLQARLFAYGDAHRYRLGINHLQLPVNAPRGVEHGATNYGRDGLMAGGTNGAGDANYYPNSRGGPVAEIDADDDHRPALAGTAGRHDPVRHAEDDDFVQAGALYRLMDEAAKERLVGNLAGSLRQVTIADVVERSVSYFTQASPELGQRLAAAIGLGEQQ